MWAKFLTAVVYPILKDLAFMIFNMLKVRALRKQHEKEAKAKLEAYKKDPSDENYAKLP